MKITDLNGYEIEVADLKEAIRVAKQYTEYKHIDKQLTEFNKKQKNYWMDIHKKLTALNNIKTTIKN